MDELYVEFDHRQLEVATDIPGVREYIAHTFAHMLVSRPTNPAGTLGVFLSKTGYRMHSPEVTDYPEMPLETILSVVKDEIRLRFMRSRPDLLWLHAGAVERDGGAVVLPAASGQGKSTLTTHLCGLGWRLLSDDIAPVRMDTDEVLPFPQSPVRRVHPGREVTADELGALEREVVAVSQDYIAAQGVTLRSLVFIAYRPGEEMCMTKLPQGTAALEILRNLTNFVDHSGAAVRRAADLARRIPVFALRYEVGSSAASVIDRHFE